MWRPERETKSLTANLNSSLLNGYSPRPGIVFRTTTKARFVSNMKPTHPPIAEAGCIYSSSFSASTCNVDPHCPRPTTSNYIKQKTIKPSLVTASPPRVFSTTAHHHPPFPIIFSSPQKIPSGKIHPPKKLRAGRQRVRIEQRLEGSRKRKPSVGKECVASDGHGVYSLGWGVLGGSLFSGVWENSVIKTPRPKFY